MSRPSYTRQDNNQLQIEQELQQLGFVVLRTSDFSSRPHSEAHPLDLFVLGLHRGHNIPMWSQWEVKTDRNAEVTESEMNWLGRAKFLFNGDVPVNFAFNTGDVLKWYKWI